MRTQPVRFKCTYGSASVSFRPPSFLLLAALFCAKFPHLIFHYCPRYFLLMTSKVNLPSLGGSLPSIAHGDRSSTSSLECLDEKRRIPAIKLAPVPGRKPTKPGRRKTKMPPPPPLVWAATPQPLTPPPRSPTAASSLPRRIELLKGSIPQLRNLRCSPRSTLTVHVKMDTQDVYQTFSLPSSSRYGLFVVLTLIEVRGRIVAPVNIIDAPGCFTGYACKFHT